MLSSLFVLTSLLQLSAPGSALGIIVRPLFFESLAQSLSKSDKGIEVNTCVRGISLVGHLKIKLQTPRFTPVPPSSLRLTFPVQDFQFDGVIARNCEEKNLPHRVLFTQGPMSVDVDVFGDRIATATPTQKDVLVAIDSTHSGRSQLTPDVKLWNLTTGNQLTNLQDFLSDDQAPNPTAQGPLPPLWGQLRESLSEMISQMIRKRLSGLFLVQSVSRFTEESPIWRKGPVFQQGGMTIELEGDPLGAGSALFTMSPYSKGGAEVTSRGLEVYAEARFLKPEDTKSILGDKAKIEDVTELENRLKEQLGNVRHWNPLPARLPSLPESDSEISLAVPISLVNEALQTVYREGLLRFKTTIHLGKQTQGILTPEAPEVQTIVRIAPQTAPQVSFAANRPMLQIRDYVLDLGTWIEDRLIPSSRIKTDSSILGDLGLGPDTVNLVLDPRSFNLTIGDLSGRMTAPQREVLQRLAQGLWKNFLNQYSNLALFKNIVSFDDAQIQIVRTEVNDTVILLHANLIWGQIRL